MTLEARKHGNDAVVIVFDGRLTLGEPVDQFRTAWNNALSDGAKKLVLNLERVTMIDSSGIGTMIRCHSAVTQAGGSVKIVGANNTVRQAFKITRLDNIFEFHDTEAAALGNA